METDVLVIVLILVFLVTFAIGWRLGGCMMRRSIYRRAFSTGQCLHTTEDVRSWLD